MHKPLTAAIATAPYDTAILPRANSATALPQLWALLRAGSRQSTAYDPARKEEILIRAYHERTSSLRGISRIFGVSRNTVTHWLKKSG